MAALVSLAACSSGPQPGAEATARSMAAGSTAPTPMLSAKPTVAGTAAARTLPTGWGPSRRQLRRARQLVSRLTLRELAGQVIVARYWGTGAPADLVTRLHLGGVIVMGDNVTSTDRVRGSNRALQRAAREAGRRWPVFIGVDQEGGIVERVKSDATGFPAFMTAGAAHRPERTRQAAAASGAELAHLGFTTVFAPVADVTSGPADPTIGSRSPGSRPDLVATQVNAAVDGYLSAGILPVVKHFPGHGSVPADSHEQLPVQDKSLRRLMRTDLAPFRAAVDGGAPAVMVAHIDVRAVDPGTPSTMSRPVVRGLLRDRLRFDGLVVTDALNMAGVAERFDSARSAVRGLQAGNDVLLMPPDPRTARNGIVRAVRSGRLDRSRLERAATRQVAVLLHQRGADPTVVRKVGGSGGISYRYSAGAVTVATGPCRGRLVGRSVSVSGPAEARARFRAAARAVGLGTGGGTSVALIGYRGGARKADVVVAMDTPYVLGRSTAPVKIAVYGDTLGAMRALVNVLVGRAEAPGRLPVPVAGVQRRGC